MSDCPATGGTHTFVLDKIETDGEGRRTEYSTCQCGAQQTITRQAESRNR